MSALHLNSSREPQHLRDLLRLMDQMRSLYQQMFNIIDAKLVAMRRSDMDAMTAMADKEAALADALAERDGMRKQLMDRIGVSVGLPPRTGRRLTVTQLGERLDVASRTALGESADQLRKAVARVSQANRVAGVVGREVVNHLRHVFAAIRPGGESPIGYSDGGAVVSSKTGPMFDAVG